MHDLAVEGVRKTEVVGLDEVAVARSWVEVWVMWLWAKAGLAMGIKAKDGVRVEKRRVMYARALVSFMMMSEST